MAVIERWQTHKALIWQAGEIARRSLLTSEATSSFSRAQVLTSVARAVTRNDTRLAGTLLRNSVVARDHLFVCGSQVLLHDAPRFSEAIDCAKQSFIGGEIEAMRDEMRRSRET